MKKRKTRKKGHRVESQEPVKAGNVTENKPKGKRGKGGKQRGEL